MSRDDERSTGALLLKLFRVHSKRDFDCRAYFADERNWVSLTLLEKKLFNDFQVVGLLLFLLLL